MKKTLAVIAAVGLLMLGGCATQRGQQYGAAGAATGATACGLFGHSIEAAVACGAIGAAAGGLIGDSMENQRGGGYYDDYRPAPPPPRRPTCSLVPMVDAWGYQVYDYNGRPEYQRVCR